MSKKAVAVVVGGGPAPGINGVISALTIEAINRGHKVYGIMEGFSRIMTGDESCLRELTTSDVSRLHKEGGSFLRTSRANPTSDPEALQRIVEMLKARDVGYFVTIGGDDTAYSARVISETAGGSISVVHVPKTIDNDLPLPGNAYTFGYQTAREEGTHIAETLMEDAKTTGRWYLMIAMGRKAGHLALGIGIASGATLTLIPEEFGDEKISIDTLVDTIAGCVIKRLSIGRKHGVVVLAEGLADLLDLESIPELQDCERDPHGNIRFAEVDFGGMLKRRVRSRLRELGIKLVVVEKNVGYELRCCPPVTFDREYTRELGYGAIDFLLNGGSGAMISLQEQGLVPIPFEDLIDPKTGKTAIRMVDLQSVAYKVAKKYMIRLTPKDLADDAKVAEMSAGTNLSPEDFRQAFASTAKEGPFYGEMG